MPARVKPAVWGCFLTALLLFGVPIALVAIGFGDASNACWEDSEAVNRARALSAERLSALYRDMKTYATADSTPLQGYSRIPGDRAIPVAFADLGAAKVRPAQANIMLEGCMDAYVDLWFEGLTNPGEPARIVLTWGDHHETGQQVLWKE